MVQFHLAYRIGACGARTHFFSGDKISKFHCACRQVPFKSWWRRHEDRASEQATFVKLDVRLLGWGFPCLCLSLVILFCRQLCWVILVALALFDGCFPTISPAPIVTQASSARAGLAILSLFHDHGTSSRCVRDAKDRNKMENGG